jgi:hypothetical protein
MFSAWLSLAYSIPQTDKTDKVLLITLVNANCRADPISMINLCYFLICQTCIVRK